MSSNQKTPEKKFTIVSEQAANQNPYPYVFVEDDGTVRELRPGEKSYLERPFQPMDGGRPAIKGSFTSKNGWGSVRGFCHRSKVPSDIEILIYDPPAIPEQQDQVDIPDIADDK